MTIGASVRRAHAPAMVWVIAVAVLVPIGIPLAYLLLEALSTDSWGTVFSIRTAELLRNTIGLVLATTSTAALLGVSAAWLVHRTDLPWRRLWATLLALPLVFPSYVGALAILSIGGNRGLVAEMAGVSAPQITGFLGAWLALSLFTYPYVFLLASASLRNLDPSLEEAARGLGASGWRVFLTVVLPQLRPAVASAGLLVGLYTLSDFGAVSLFRYDTLTRAIYTNFIGRIDRTPALALAAVLILIALAALAVEQRTRGRAQFHVRRAARPPRHLALSRRGRFAATAFVSSLTLAALIAPTSVLIWWLMRGVSLGQDLGSVWIATGDSLLASAFAGLAAMVAAVPITVLTVRYASRLTRTLERGVWALYALPHITVGIAMVYFAANFVQPLYQSLPLLTLAYVALFLPQATSAGQAALRQVNPTLEEASRSLGTGWTATLARVTLPLIGPGLLAGGALVFLTVMKELPATLLLRPTGFDTLAVRIWATSAEGFFTRASAAALILLAVSAIPMYLLNVRTSDA